MVGTQSTPPGRPEAPRSPTLARDLVIADIAHLLVSEGSPAAVLSAVADALEQVVPHDALTLYSADARVRLLRPALARGVHSEETLALDPLPYGEGVIGSAADSGEPRRMSPIGLHREAPGAPATDGGRHSLIAIPLLARGELKGVLCLYRLAPHAAFSEDEFKTAIRFSVLAALAIDNADIRSKLESLAMSDHLTGLYNHRYFQERLLEEVSRANRHRTSVSLLLYDIDDFKEVNDSYGHLLGDQVLQGVASAAGEICRIDDPVCRIGGEEFGVILPGQTGTQAQILGERIRRAVLELSFPMQTRVTVSLGLAEAPMNASSPRDLFACADLALRTAKSQGKNRVCVYAGSTLGPRRDSSRDYPLSGRWEVLTEGTETGRLELTSEVRSDAAAGHARMAQTRSIGQIEMLRRVSSNLNRLHDVTRIAEMIRVELKTSTECRGCGVYLLAEDGETLVSAASAAQAQGDGPGSHTGGLAPAIATEASRSGQTIYVPDASGSHPTQSLLASPMRFDGQVIGVIVLSKLGSNQFDEDDTRLLETLASIAAIAFQNARLFEARSEAARTLEGAYLSTVEALANALEAQDEYTSDHARTLAEMALSVGSDLGLKDTDLSSLELAALFHDIGKIGVPSEIIRKPGPLTAEERLEMERHPAIGERILAPVPFLQSIRPLVRACHERWDGGGYPDGLSGQRIPLQSRIVFVCDAFHAMSTDRPYRSALPEDEAIRRIVMASGSQFDPLVVESFGRLYKQGGIPFTRHHGAEARNARLTPGVRSVRRLGSTVR